MIVLATVATVIASQAVISGAFLVTRQAIRLGFLPRLTIVIRPPRPPARSTRRRSTGSLRVGHRSRRRLRLFGALGSAYGIAVTGTITVDTVLFLVVARALWQRPISIVLAGAAVFLTVDFAFLGANIPRCRTAAGSRSGWES